MERREEGAQVNQREQVQGLTLLLVRTDMNMTECGKPGAQGSGDRDRHCVTFLQELTA